MVGKRVVTKGADPYKDMGVVMMAPSYDVMEMDRRCSSVSTASSMSWPEQEDGGSITSSISGGAADEGRGGSRAGYKRAMATSVRLTMSSIDGSEYSYVEEEGSGVSMPSGLYI